MLGMPNNPQEEGYLAFISITHTTISPISLKDPIPFPLLSFGLSSCVSLTETGEMEGRFPSLGDAKETDANTIGGY
ncbi:hypothetical protein NSQ41_17775 [Aeribacillus sp. FSL K6-8210]|uniref:hypothetical protein n=1 Tax=unclassified Aeribacillus TaxID=2640495 RepID=UPI0030CE491A